MSSNQQILQWIKNQHDDMCQLVFDWSNINTGTKNTQGLAEMLSVIKERFQTLSPNIEQIQLSSYQELNRRGEFVEAKLGDVLRLTHREQAPFKILLCGHMDTVFDEDHEFQTTTVQNNNIMNGPGVTDMKGGIIVMLYALLALERYEYKDNIGWEVLLTPDEEIGSPGSASLLEAASERVNIGLVYEPAKTPDGMLASTRKGSAKYSMIVRGQAAHAGRVFHEGRNAITLMAKVIQQIDALNGQREGVTLNIGLIQGGSAINVVPARCVCHIDIRTQDKSDEAWLVNTLNEIVASYAETDGYEVELHGQIMRQPKLLNRKTQRLFDLIANVGRELDLDIHWQPSGGCCDGNNLAARGLPVVDSLGVRGNFIHSEREMIYLDSLVERTQLSALLFMKLASGEASLD